MCAIPPQSKTHSESSTDTQAIAKREPGPALGPSPSGYSRSLPERVADFPYLQWLYFAVAFLSGDAFFSPAACSAGALAAEGGGSEGTRRSMIVFPSLST